MLAVLLAVLAALGIAPARAADALAMWMEGGAEPPSPAAAVRDALEAVAGSPVLALEIRDGANAARAFKPAVRRGDADMAAIPLAVLARESGLYAFDRIPYLATTPAAARRLFAAAADPVAQRLAEDGMVLLALEPRPAIGILTRTPLSDIAGFAGKRVWTQDAATRRLAELAGAVPEPDAARADALLVGAAEAMALIRARTLKPGPWSYLPIAGWHPARAVVISAKRLAALPAETRRRLTALQTDVADRWWSDAEAGSAAAQRTLADAGHTVEPVTAQLAAGLARIGQQMAAEWMPGAGADGATLLDALRGADHKP